MWSHAIAHDTLQTITVTLKVGGSEATQLRIENFEHLNPEPYPQSTYSLLDNPDQTVNRESFMKANAQLRITREYRKHIQTQIYDALVWMHEKHHHPKLEGRQVANDFQIVSFYLIVFDYDDQGLERLVGLRYMGT